METAEFDYHLPEELIAQHPCPERDQARMLVVDRTAAELVHARVADLPAYLRPGDLLVLNDTRVVPCRLTVRREDTGGRGELFVLEDVGGGRWDALFRARRRPAPGSRWTVEPDGGVAEVLAVHDRGRVTVAWHGDRPLPEVLDAAGRTPLPPYIRRPDARDEPEDRRRYQTIYAREPGAVAAPTAGLHFTPALLDRLRGQGVETAFLTLHVGLGTFRPVTADRVEDHEMDAERYRVPPEAADAVNRARGEGRRVVAVGSTSVRTLETAAGPDGTGRAGEGRSGLFIVPGHRFRAVDAMLTNFHLPRSTLVMMVSALAGRERILAAYAEAVRRRYRFYSYGDSMLIL